MAPIGEQPPSGAYGCYDLRHMTPRGRVAVAATGTVVVLGTLGYLGYRIYTSRQIGRVVCPAELGRSPANTIGVVAGDKLVVLLASKDGSFAQSTWATVLNPRTNKIRVQLSGEQAEAGGYEPLDTSHHGFAFGDKLTLARDCVFDVYRPTRFNGQILCGAALAVLDAQVSPHFRTAPDANTVDRGAQVQIVVASLEQSGTAWYEPLWVTITKLSPTGQVLMGTIDERPKLTEHGLGQGQEVSFNRDCIVAIA